MNIEKKVKITLASVYLLLIVAFLRFLFTNFSINDFTSYEIIKSNRDTLNNLKNINIFFSVSVFLLISIIYWSFWLSKCVDVEEFSNNDPLSFVVAFLNFPLASMGCLVSWSYTSMINSNSFILRCYSIISFNIFNWWCY